MLLTALSASCGSDVLEVEARPKSYAGIYIPLVAVADDILGGRPRPANPFGGCLVCHVHAGNELKGTRHGVRGVDCVKCHGPSKEHGADENNEVAPDRVFARRDIRALCTTCHQCSRRRSFRLRLRRRTCTDCHGAHKVTR